MNRQTFSSVLLIVATLGTSGCDLPSSHQGACVGITEDRQVVDVLDDEDTLLGTVDELLLRLGVDHELTTTITKGTETETLTFIVTRDGQTATSQTCERIHPAPDDPDRCESYPLVDTLCHNVLRATVTISLQREDGSVTTVDGYIEARDWDRDGYVSWDNDHVKFDGTDFYLYQKEHGWEGGWDDDAGERWSVVQEPS